VSPGEIERLALFRQYEGRLRQRIEELEFWLTMRGRAAQVRVAAWLGTVDSAWTTLAEVSLNFAEAEAPVVRAEAEAIRAAMKLLEGINQRLTKNVLQPAKAHL